MKRIVIRLELNLRELLDAEANRAGQYTATFVAALLAEQLALYGAAPERYTVHRDRRLFAPCRANGAKSAGRQMSLFLSDENYALLTELCDRVGERPRLIVPGLLLNSSVCGILTGRN